MKRKPINTLISALRDFDAAAVYYDKNSMRTAQNCHDVAQAYRLIQKYPAAACTLKYELDLHIPGLRTLAMAKFPYLIFYIEHSDHIDVVRILHGMRDIPKQLAKNLDSPT